MKQWFKRHYDPPTPLGRKLQSSLGLVLRPDTD